MPTQPVTQHRVHRGEDEWRAIISRFELSGQTRRQFCAEHRVGLSTFTRWRNRLRGIEPSVSPCKGKAMFIELTTPVPEAPAPAWDVELELGSGVTLRLRRTGC